MSDANPSSWPAPRVTSAVASYRKVTSFVLLSQRSSVRVSGDAAAHDRAYRAAQRHTSMAGWWGVPFGVMWTPVALAANRKTRRSVDEVLGAVAQKPAWFKDPSGKPGERYWDGSQWTEQVRITTTDAPPSTSI
jgi:hypothetical protein